MLTDSHNSLTHAESITVRSIWYGRQRGSPMSEFILIQVEEAGDEDNQELTKYLVLERFVFIEGPRLGKLLRNPLAMFPRFKAFDNFKISLDGNLERFLSDCAFYPCDLYENLDFPSEHPLYLYQLAVLADAISTRSQYGTNTLVCHFFAGAIWDTLRFLYPTAVYHKSSTNSTVIKDRWPPRLRLIRDHPQAQEIVEQVSEEIAEASLKVASLNVTTTNASPDSQGTSPRKLMVTTETSLDDIVNYFEQVAKLDNYTSSLDHDKPLDQRGRGGCADVYRVATTSGTYVAVKCIVMDSRTGINKTLKRTARELEVWSRLKHDNVLELLGLAKFNNRVAMVSSWMESGSVVKYVNDHPEKNRYSLSRQIVGAVAYLHSQIPGIVHGDIKGDNILICPEGKPKLTDFGLTIMAESNLILSATDTGGGTMRWMAPELLTPQGRRSKEADVYALGMTILETLTGQPPFAEIKSAAAIPGAVMMQRLTPRRPAVLLTRSRLNDAFWEAMTRCWVYEPAQRAKVTQVEKLITNALKQSEIVV